MAQHSFPNLLRPSGVRVKATLGFYGERVVRVRMRRKTKKKLKKEMGEKKEKDEED